MVVFNNEKLEKYTTFKIGGIAEKLYVPQGVDELQQLLKCITGEERYILSGGSNLLINDKKIFKNVISLQNVDNSIVDYSDGKFYVGSSVRIQKFINYAKEKGYGGLEFLYSVPGMLGGLIAMNAGRGEGWNQSISNYIIQVQGLVNNQVKTFKKEECNFEYRTSKFIMSDNIIVGAVLQLDKDTPDHIDSLISERMNTVKATQERNKANFGSVFSQSNAKIMNIVRKVGLGRKKGVHFSKKTTNWLVNEGNGTYAEALALIKIVRILHKLFNKECTLEIQIWD